MSIWGESILGRGNSTCKGPEEGAAWLLLWLLEKSEEARLAEYEREKGGNIRER